MPPHLSQARWRSVCTPGRTVSKTERECSSVGTCEIERRTDMINNLKLNQSATISCSKPFISSVEHKRKYFEEGPHCCFPNNVSGWGTRTVELQKGQILKTIIKVIHTTHALYSSHTIACHHSHSFYMENIYFAINNSLCVLLKKVRHTGFTKIIG